MTGGAGGRGFFAGAVGGLALALLLVGVASLLPSSNSALQTAPTPHENAAPGSAASLTATSTTGVSSTTTAGGAQFTATQSGAQNAVKGAPGSSSATATTSAATTTAAASTTTATIAAGAASGTTYPAAQGLGGLTASNGAQQRLKPSSQLTALPGESVESLIATISPLLLGFLAAALVYGAYVRHQDSSS